MTPRPTTPAVRQVILARFRSGTSRADLATETGYSVRTIDRVLRGFGVSLGPPGRRRLLDGPARVEMARRYVDDGWSIRQLARRYRVGYATARNALLSVGVELRPRWSS